MRLLFWAQMLLILLVVGAGLEYGSMAAGNSSDSGNTTFVVIVSGPTCDATRINPVTVALGGWRIIKEQGGGPRPFLKDVDGDNLQDLLLPIPEGRLPNNSNAMQLTAVTYEGVSLDPTWFALEVESSTGAIKKIALAGSQHKRIGSEPCVEGPITKSIVEDVPTFGRPVSNGIASSCAAPKPCPGTRFPGVFAAFDLGRVNNSAAPICVTVSVTAISCASGVHTAAFVGDQISFVDICMTYAGDSGQSTGTNGSTTFSFNVPPGEIYSFVFFEDTPGALCSSFSYTITLSPCFNVCLQDDGNGNILQFNSGTGNYLFTSCSTGLTLTGTGTSTSNGCTIAFQHVSADRRVTANVDNCQQRGSASVVVIAPRRLTMFAITDTNTANNTCFCP